MPRTHRIRHALPEEDFVVEVYPAREVRSQSGAPNAARWRWCIKLGTKSVLVSVSEFDDHATALAHARTILRCLGLLVED